MKIKLVVIGVLLATLAAVEAKEINMLFIGNSFTARPNLPQLVKQVFEEGQPDLTMNVESVIYGGQDLFRHHDLYFSETRVRLNSITINEVEEKIDAIKSLQAGDPAPDFYNAYWEKTGTKPRGWKFDKKILSVAVSHQKKIIGRIKNNDRVKWDYLVLQSWKDVVTDVDAGYGEYAQKWAKLAEKEGIKVILYIPAPHAQNQEPVKGTLELAQTKMELKTIQQLVKRINPYAVVPVALGIKNVQQNGTDLTFRYVNDFHLNQYTGFLTANMFYASFFKKSTEGFKFNTVVETNPKGKKKGQDPDGGAAKVVFDETTKVLLQKAAFEAVMEFNAGYGK